MLTLNLGLLWLRSKVDNLQRSLLASVILGRLWFYATSFPKSCLLKDNSVVQEQHPESGRLTSSFLPLWHRPGGMWPFCKFSFRCWLVLMIPVCRKGQTQNWRRKKTKYRAERSRGQQATARGVWEGVLHVPTRMVLHTSPDTFDIEVNHVFQLFGERHCCGFRKDDLQVQPKPSHQSTCQSLSLVK